MNSELFNRAKDIIENQLRPMIQGDGGDIEAVALTDKNVLQVRLQGACVHCPSSAVTMSFGVEARLKEWIPEITGVELLN